MKPSVLIAVGCSWVAGAYMDTNPTATDFDYNHQVDTEYRDQNSFAGLVQQQLGLDQIHFVARNGASNDNQLRNLIAFLNRHKDEYSKIFVLWGLTSIYRWEVFSNTLGYIEDSAFGRDTHKPEVLEEIKYYYSHFWNREYELEKLGNKILLANGYLKSLNIDHLIFNSFQGYSTEEMLVKNIEPKYFYHHNTSDNDLLSFLCNKNNVQIKKTSVPFLNLLRPAAKQMNSSSIRELQKSGWLDCATAHPTVKAHKKIANELYDYIKEKNNERI
jgi:hypothetical protein